MIAVGSQMPILGMALVSLMLAHVVLLLPLLRGWSIHASTFCFLPHGQSLRTVGGFRVCPHPWSTVQLKFKGLGYEKERIATLSVKPRCNLPNSGPSLSTKKHSKFEAPGLEKDGPQNQLSLSLVSSIGLGCCRTSTPGTPKTPLFCAGSVKIL